MDGTGILKETAQALRAINWITEAEIVERVSCCAGESLRCTACTRLRDNN